jgi:metallo-beta-lactamase class B
MILAAAVVAAASVAAPRAGAQSPDWTEPFPPFHIAGNLYYVGSKGLANYLITTPQGNILINSDLEANVPLIKASIEKLGFRFSDTKILLISHAHWDHDAASATVKQLTGAKYMVMDADVPVVESGGKDDFFYGGDPAQRYPVAKVDRVLHDGDEVKLGGTVLVAHLTPGHTKGCTTWTMKVNEGGKSYDVVIVGSPNVNAGFKLVGNTRYPNIAQDYERTFRVLKALPVDYFLGAHGAYFNLDAKYPRMKDGAPSPFIDREGYQKYVDEREQAFLKELAQQRAAQQPAPAAPTTAVMAVLTVRPDADRATITRTMPAEIRATVQLYLDGKIQQWYAKADGRGVMFIFNCATVAEAKALTDELPLVKGNLASFEFTALTPLTPLRYLMPPPPAGRGNP